MFKLANIISLIIVSLSAGVYGQNSTSTYFSFDTQIELPEEDKISLFALGSQAIKLIPGDEIQLTPPDIALIDPIRILSLHTDTLTLRDGSRKCISECIIDSLFINEDLFLERVKVYVQYFEDGTFEGESSFGWEALEEAGKTKGPQKGKTGRNYIKLAPVFPSSLTARARINKLVDMDPSYMTTFPFQPGDIDEIRFVSCSQTNANEEKINHMVSLLQAQSVFCQFPSVDPNVPPINAINRIQHPVTIRYFEDLHMKRAAVLAESISYVLDIPMSDIYLEDMQPYYGGKVPVQDYLEVWFQ